MRKLILLIWLALLGFYVAWPAWTGYQIRQAFETEDAALLESKVDFPSVRTSLKPVLAAEAEAYLERLKRDVGPLGGLLSGQIKGELTGRLVETAVSSAITPPNVIRMVRDGRSVKQSLEKVMVDQAGAGGGLRLPGLGGRRNKSGAVDSADNDPNRVAAEPAPAAKSSGAAVAGGSVPFKEIDPQARAIGTAGSAPAAPPAAGAGPAGAGERTAAPQKGTPDQTTARRPRLGLANLKSFSIEGPFSFTVGVAKDAAATEPEVAATLRFTGGDWKVVAVTPDFAARRANRQ